MENKKILASLTNIANELDINGLYDEANIVTNIAENLTRKITAQYTGPGSTGEYLSQKKQRYLDNEIERFQGRSERERATPAPDKKARDEAYKRIIEYAKSWLYDSRPDNKFTKEQRIRNAIDYILGEMERNPLLTGQQKNELSKQWGRIVSDYKKGINPGVAKLDVQEIKKPLGNIKSKIPGTNIELPDSKTQPSKLIDGTKEEDIKSKLYRWVNKAENIYKKWDNTLGSRDNNSIMSMLQDISDYLKQMKSFSSRQAKPFVDDAIDKVDAMYAKVLVSVGDLGTTTLFTPEYKDVTGFPRKEKNPFEEGARLTGQKLKEQAKLEGRSL